MAALSVCPSPRVLPDLRLQERNGGSREGGGSSQRVDTICDGVSCSGDRRVLSVFGFLGSDPLSPTRVLQSVVFCNSAVTLLSPLWRLGSLSEPERLTGV